MEAQTLVKEICPTTTQSWVKDGALLIDVREKEEVAQLTFDVPHIINIPLSEFEERFAEIPKDQQVVVVDTKGSKSLRAAGFLVNHGYTKAVNMKYGLERWVQKGYPTNGDTSIVLADDAQGSASSCC